MKFYLTKAAQRAAEGGSSKAAPKAKAAAPKTTKPEKAPRLEKVAVDKVPAPSTPAAPANAPTAVLETTAPPAKVRAPKAEKAVRQAKQPKGVIAIGGQPRVDLLPLEVRAERKAGLQVRRAWLAVGAVVVLVGIATGASTIYAGAATASLSSAQDHTAYLTAQAGKYSAVKTTQSKVDLIDAARLVGGSTDVDWTKYLGKIALTLPDGVTATSMNVSAASPVLDFSQPTTPLEGQRVGTITFQVTATTLPEITTWLSNLTNLTGYVDASAGNVTQGDGSGSYSANVVLHINQKVFSNAYAKGN